MRFDALLHPFGARRDESVILGREHSDELASAG